MFKIPPTQRQTRPMGINTVSLTLLPIIRRTMQNQINASRLMGCTQTNDLVCGADNARWLEQVDEHLQTLVTRCTKYCFILRNPVTRPDYLKFEIYLKMYPNRNYRCTFLCRYLSMIFNQQSIIHYANRRCFAVLFLTFVT